MLATLQRQAAPRLRDAGLWLLALPFMLIGLCAGLLVSFYFWALAAILTGYVAGRLKD